jgi:hypothetical protein
MPHFRAVIREPGAVARLRIEVPAPKRALLARHGLAIPGAVDVDAEIDTGSPFTMVDPSVIRGLDLSLLAFQDAFTPSTGPEPHRFETYLVGLSLVDPLSGDAFSLGQQPVLASVFSSREDVSAAIGRDVLGHCLLVYDGKHDTFALAF